MLQCAICESPWIPLYPCWKASGQLQIQRWRYINKYTSHQQITYEFTAQSKCLAQLKKSHWLTYCSPLLLSNVCRYKPRTRRENHSLVVFSSAGMLPRACSPPQGPECGSLCPYTFKDTAPSLINKYELDTCPPFYTCVWLSLNSSCFSNCPFCHRLRDATDNCSFPHKWEQCFMLAVWCIILSSPHLYLEPTLTTSLNVTAINTNNAYLQQYWQRRLWSTEVFKMLNISSNIRKKPISIIAWPNLLAFLCLRSFICKLRKLNQVH